MKTSNWQKILAAVVVTGVAAAGSTALAQTSETNAPSAVSTPAAPPQLAYGVPQIIQLTQAKIGDDTILAYIKNSGISYNLDANQIIYLRQQGVSDAVITVMLNQPRAAMTTPPPAPYTPPPTTYTPPPTTYSPPADTTASTAPATAPAVAPSVTYVQTAPPTTYYYSSPYYYPSYGYYPGYYYPPVSLSLGWGWGWGGGWHGGGWGGGWHGGGGFRR